MIVKGSRVKVTDSYSGGLDDVIGISAKVLAVHVEGGKTSYLLDAHGNRTTTYNYGDSYGERTYTSQYPVIVDASEIEEHPYDYKDMNGNLVEIGDTVVYGVHGGGLIKGVVVDIKDVTRVRWGRDLDELKIKVESDYVYYRSDGGDRRIPNKTKGTQWLSGQSRTLIIQKNIAEKFFVSKDLLILDA